MNAGAPIPFPDEFNAAAYFIDRHLQEERSDKIAIECEGLCVTYRQLYEGVNRVGNGLRKLGVWTPRSSPPASSARSRSEPSPSR